MKVSESANCVAYHYKQKYPVISGPIKTNDPRFDLDHIKSYVLFLTDRARKTKTQQRIRREIVSSATPEAILKVVDRVIKNGDNTDYIEYYAR